MFFFSDEEINMMGRYARLKDFGFIKMIAPKSMSQIKPKPTDFKYEIRGV